MSFSAKAFSSVRSKIINTFIADDEVLCEEKFAPSIVRERENYQLLYWKDELSAILPMKFNK